MRTLAKRITWLVVALGAVSAAGCGAGGSSPVGTAGGAGAGGAGTSQAQTVEFVSFLQDAPGYAQALDTLLKINKSRHPEDNVVYTGSNSDPQALTSQMAERIAAGNPPEVITLLNSGLMPFLQMNGPNSLYVLNDFLASPAEADSAQKLYPELLADGTIDGKIYGVPGSAYCWNTLFYNKTVFAAHKLNPPTTLDEFRTVCQTLKAAGVTPLTTQMPSTLIEDLAPAIMGIDAYYSYRTGGAPDETLLRKVVDLVAEVVDNNYMDPGYLEMSPDADPYATFMKGGAAMFLVGDYAHGILQELGWTPGVDYGIAFPPGNAGLFSYASDLHLVMSGAPHRQGALNLIDTTISLQGQTEFNKYAKGIPARSDVNVNAFDSERQVTLQAMNQAKYRLSLGLAPIVPWSQAISSFAQSTPHDKEALFQVLLTTH